MKLAKLSIAAKLYVIFALLATMTVALAAVAIFNADRHVALTNEFKSAFVGAENVERINSLIYAVVMESRGIYMSPDIATAKKFAEGLTRFNDQIGGVMEGWQKSVRPEDADVFAQFAARVKKFQEFRRELVRRGTEISPASGREWGDNDANRTVRTALTNDLDVLGRLYAQSIARNLWPDRKRHGDFRAGDDGARRGRVDAGDVRRAGDTALDRASACRRHPRHRGGRRRRRRACRAVSRSPR